MLPGVKELFIPGTEVFAYDKLDEVRIFLRDFDQSQLATVEEHKEYILLVSKFRTLIEQVTKQNGARFLETIKGLLSVGDDGLYTNQLRFLFELIQNVDDCDYDTDVTPKLRIDFNLEKGQLILRYNEIGFTPGNVFSITGIAEAAKNTEDNKLQIGEKGIGFKSVFGVADSVLIRSGLFSFRLNRDHFTIPEAEYSNEFQRINGTELTLEFASKGTLEAVKQSILRRYSGSNAVFTQNLVVFLNKLTGVEFWNDGEQFLAFKVTRPPELLIDAIKGISASQGMTLTMQCRGCPDRSIRGTCFCKTIKYSRELCQARYGANTGIQSRELKVEAFFPDVAHVVNENGRGVLKGGLLYSFLPTQVEVSVPVICHAPFKLDASREYVDTQNQNSWFKWTMASLSSMLHSCYRLYANEVHENIIAYIPEGNGSRNSFFVSVENNAKMRVLAESSLQLRGSEICKDKIFYCDDAQFHAASEVIGFHKSEEIEDPLTFLRLIQNEKPFFYSPMGLDPVRWGMSVIEEPYRKLFETVFGNKNANLHDSLAAAQIVVKKNPNLFGEAFRQMSLKLLNENHLLALSEIGELHQLVNSLVKHLRNFQHSNLSFYRLSGNVQSVKELIGESFSFDYDDMGKNSSAYFRRINGHCFVVPVKDQEGECVPAENICVILGNDPGTCLINLCRKLDPDSLFSVRLKLKKASRDLDAAMSTDNPRDFLSQLRQIRIASKDAMGNKAYQNYLDLIQKSGTTEGRYITELLQNADDCEFAEEIVPTVEIIYENGTLTVSTNEIGFKTNHVRAITAIGESTKNLLLEGNQWRTSIGEKGVGFKSIFAIADSVEIHSGGFDFSLTEKEPTIPKLLPCIENTSGTLMQFKLKPGFVSPSFTPEQILELCACLRHLRRIKLQDLDVLIEDDSRGIRRVTVNGEEHIFRFSEHQFMIYDSDALRSRNVGGKRFQSAQKIRCYVPKVIRKFEYPLYCGLPLKIRTCAPVIIDVPFELTTSRDAILEDSLWNKHVRENVYKAVRQTVHTVIREMKDCRINALHFLGEMRTEVRNGSEWYQVKLFNGIGEDFLNAVATTKYIQDLQESELLPIAESSDGFVKPADCQVRVFPDFLSKILRGIKFSDCQLKRIDFTGALKIERLRSVLEVLRVKSLSEKEFWHVLSVLGNLQEWMFQADFRDGVYSFLGKLKTIEDASSYPIVPVVTDQSPIFVRHEGSQFYYSTTHRVSTRKYYILDDKLMSRKAYEAIFKEDLREMNDAQEREIYNTQIVQYVQNHSTAEVYHFLMSELSGLNRFKLQDGWPWIQRQCSGRIPLKNRLGEITCSKCYLLDTNITFESVLVKRMVVSDESMRLASLLYRPNFFDIVYEDLPKEPNALGEADVKVFEDPRFKRGKDILFLAVKNGRISPELAEKYGLVTGLFAPIQQKYDFPIEPIQNIERLRSHIAEQISNPIRIVSKMVPRSIQFAVMKNGGECELGSINTRNEMLSRYAPQGYSNLCFCQMCGNVEPSPLIEVNALESEPPFFWSQLRLALCLRCSKEFTLLRNNQKFRHDLIQRLMTKQPLDDRQNVNILVKLSGGMEFRLQFTRTHFAEIQEILRRQHLIEEEGE